MVFYERATAPLVFSSRLSFLWVRVQRPASSELWKNVRRQLQPTNHLQPIISMYSSYVSHFFVDSSSQKPKYHTPLVSPFVTMKRRIREALVLAWVLVVAAMAFSTDALSASNPQLSNKLPRTFLARRTMLSTMLSAPILSFVAVQNAESISVADPPLPQFISTVVLEEPGVSVGAQLFDIKVGANSYTAVKSVQPEGLAAMSGVREGMILLSKDATAASTVNRIKNRAGPMVLQFYNLAEGDTTRTPLEALQAAVQRGEAELARKEPPLQSKGTGLLVKTVRKGDCRGGNGAKRGDTLVINYEARVASPGGPIYDSTAMRGNPVEFRLGKNEAIKGVDIGLNGMCEGEVRELDIPSLLGYGQFGSDYFDVPGDVRLWWRAELVKLTK